MANALKPIGFAILGLDLVIFDSAANSYAALSPAFAKAQGDPNGRVSLTAEARDVLSEAGLLNSGDRLSPPLARTQLRTLPRPAVPPRVSPRDWARFAIAAARAAWRLARGRASDAFALGRTEMPLQADLLAAEMERLE